MLFPSSFSVLPLVQPLPSACSLAAAHGWKRPTVGQRRGCSSPAANPPTANSNSQQPAASSAQPTSRRQHSFPRARLLHACASLLSPPFARLATAPLATAAWSWSDFPPTPTTPCFVLVGASPRAARGVDDHAVEKPPGTVAVTQPKTPRGKKGGHCPTRHPRWRSTETPGRRYLFTANPKLACSNRPVACRCRPTDRSRLFQLFLFIRPVAVALDFGLRFQVERAGCGSYPEPAGHNSGMALPVDEGPERQRPNELGLQIRQLTHVYQSLVPTSPCVAMPSCRRRRARF